jgi:hypothetical protein
MSKYSGKGAAAVGTDKTILNLFEPGSSMVRAEIVELLVSCGATPADLMTIFFLMRSTAVGTEGSGFTPVPTDPAFKAASCDFGVAHSAEPTYTANSELLDFALHQRALHRWLAEPGFGLILPATASNGIGLKSSASGGTAIHRATMFFLE